MLSAVIFVVSGIVLLATTVILSSILYIKVYAADNCDAESICTNTGIGSTQSNNCTQTKCTNEGDGSIQNNKCTSIGIGQGCNNRGDGSIQNNVCSDSGLGTCDNSGDSSIQNNVCPSSNLEIFCVNGGDNSNQNINCNRIGGGTCRNSGDGSSMSMNCLDVGGFCSNEGSGSSMSMNCAYTGETGSCSQHGIGSTFNMNCARMEQGCSNFANPSGSSMNVNCVDGGACRNFWTGNDGSVTQSLTCHKSVCANDARPGLSGTTQTTICNNAGGFFPEGCVNTGRDTTVLANGAPCKSGAPRTTTICQPGRTFTIPN
jgi:hypothetical protein